MRQIGYLRVSTTEQCLDRQADALVGLCDEVHIERLSAAHRKRPVYQKIVRRLRPGDTLVVLDLDRAFRSVLDAISEIDRLHAQQIGLRIVNLAIDTTTPAGRLVLVIMSAFAEFERSMIVQRTREGLAAARRRGTRLGRPPKLSPAQIESARYRLDTQTASLASLGTEFGVAPWTVKRSIARQHG